MRLIVGSLKEQLGHCSRILESGAGRACMLGIGRPARTFPC